MSDRLSPRLEIRSLAGGGSEICLSGDWTLKALAAQTADPCQRLDDLAATASARWNCLEVTAMDSAAALLLWRRWGRVMPVWLVARPDHLRILQRVAAVEMRPARAGKAGSPFDGIVWLGIVAFDAWRHVLDFVALIGQMSLDFAHLVRRPRDVPWREFSATIYKSGVRAMPVTAAVGFLIGVVLSYLSALQLRQFGADLLIINILGVGIIRELGPVLVAVLVAGRSGSAMTAQLGVMRVTEEIDALAAMGVPRSLRLLLPKVAALAVTMPMLVLWASAMAMLGAMLTAQWQLDLAPGFFFSSLARVVPLANLWIALSKGIVFGMIVGLLACHFGLRVRPNTESLSANTTASVVTAITAVILADALFAIFTRQIGLPR